MHRWISIWLQTATWQRLVSFSVAAMLLVIMLWFGWLDPIQKQQQRLEQQGLQQAQRYRQQLASLRSIPALFALQQQAQQLKVQLSPDESVPFSLATLLETSGAVLEYWRPAGQGGELSLMLNWPQFIALMDYLLSLRPAPAIPQFSLQREQQQLRLVMELTDAP